MRIYLDDIRKCPYDDWETVRTAEEAIDLLREEEVDEISLDHDLGTVLTGYDVACYIEGLVFQDRDYVPPKIYIHSANPVGIRKIQQAIDSIDRKLEDRK
jgi:hypothetical protein